jgi:hypothetical protein
MNRNTSKHNAPFFARAAYPATMQQPYMQHYRCPNYIPSDFAGGARYLAENYMLYNIRIISAAMDALRKRAKKLGAGQLEISTRAAKKYMVKYRGRWIHFGARSYSDFTQHRSPRRRENYRARHSKILLADGRPAYKVPEQAAYWAWHILW